MESITFCVLKKKHFETNMNYLKVTSINI